jgi:hypothetical protein
MWPLHNAEAALLHYNLNINTTTFAIKSNMACKSLLFGGAGEEGLGERCKALGGRGGFGSGLSGDDWHKILTSAWQARHELCLIRRK